MINLQASWRTTYGVLPMAFSQIRLGLVFRNIFWRSDPPLINNFYEVIIKWYFPIFDNVSLDIMANLIKMIFFLLNNYKILRKKIKKWQKCMNYENWDFLFAFIQLTFLLVTISCQCQYSPSYLHTPLFKIYLEFETFM